MPYNPRLIDVLATATADQHLNVAPRIGRFVWTILIDAACVREHEVGNRIVVEIGGSNRGHVGPTLEEVGVREIDDAVASETSRSVVEDDLARQTLLPVLVSTELAEHEIDGPIAIQVDQVIGEVSPGWSAVDDHSADPRVGVVDGERPVAVVDHEVRIERLVAANVVPSSPPTSRSGKPSPLKSAEERYRFTGSVTARSTGRGERQ